MSEPATTAPAARPARILRSAAVVGAMTAVSRVAGVVREQLMAYAFGTSLAKSAFNVAFQLPNLFRRLFGEGALASAFVPVYTDVLEKEGQEEANRLFARVAGLLVAVLSIISAIGILIALALQHWWFTPDSRWAMILPGRGPKYRDGRSIVLRRQAVKRARRPARRREALNWRPGCDIIPRPRFGGAPAWPIQSNASSPGTSAWT